MSIRLPNLQLHARGIVIATGLACALAIRLFFVLTHPGNYDSRCFEQATAAIRDGQLYSGSVCFSYSPLWPLFLLSAKPIANLLSLPFQRLLGLLLLGGDAATALLLYRLCKEPYPGEIPASHAAVLFFLNPVSIFASSFHLQIDNLAVLFLLAAILAMRKHPASQPSASAFLSLSLLVKHVTWFHPLLCIWPKRRDRRWLLTGLLPYLVFLVSFLPFWRSWQGMRVQVFGYRGLAEDYGMRRLLTIFGVPNWFPTLLFAAGALAAILLLSRLEVRLASLLLFLVLLILLPGIVQYYFVWPVALGSMSGGWGYCVYTVVTALFLIGSPDGLDLQQKFSHLPDWAGPWWALVFWLLWEVRALRQARRGGIARADNL